MMPNMNPAQMAKVMKQMGIKTKEISSSKVVIECEDGNLVITNPSITEIEMQGKKSYQISGNVSKETQISDEDVKMVMEQASVDKEQAKKALEKSNGDIAEAIMQLK